MRIMPPIVIAIEIDRSPEDVFGYATDPPRFPEWQRDVVRVEMDGDPRTVGSRFTSIRRFAGAEQRLVQEVSEVAPPHRWAARAVSGPIRPDAALTIEPLDDGARSRVTFTIEYEAGGIGRLILPLVTRQTRSAAPVSFRRLKERLEIGPTEPART
jgi:uncharacterized protein YndB with AHSA1/START domain